MLQRRRVPALALAFAVAVAALVPAAASGSVARALSLGALVRASHAVVEATPLDGFSRWEDVGKRRRIVTYTRLRVDRPVRGAKAGDELLVRTLGGRVDDVGQVVHGEAVLVPGEAALLFLTADPAGTLAVTGLAQGHYPFRADPRGVRRLAPSPRVAELAGTPRDAAVVRLVGLTPDAARAAVAAERTP